MKRLLIIGAALGFGVAACDPAPEPQAEPERYNDADIAFMQGMIPHHQEAIAMAELVPDRTDRPELLELANDVIASQRVEIEQMREKLRDAGAEPDAMEITPTAMDHDMDHGDDAHMTREEMQALEAAQGEEFDILFAELMIRHHEGAVESAQRVLEEGQNPRVAELAREIIAEQEAEIQQLRGWLEAWQR